MNKSERDVKDKLEAIGYRVLRNGWPDFLILNSEGRIICVVEVKSGIDTVRPAQKQIHEALEAAGIRVYVVHESRADRFISEMAERLHGANWAPLVRERQQVHDYLERAKPKEFWDRVMPLGRRDDDDASQVGAR